MTVQPPEGLRDKILAAAAEQPAPLRSQVRLRNIALIGGAVVLALVEFFFVGGFREWGAPRSIGLILGTVLGTAAVASATAWVATTRGRTMIERARSQLLWLIVLAPLAIFAWKVGFTALFEGGLDIWPTRFGHKCMMISLTIGLFPVVAYAIGNRGAHPVHPGTSGAAIGIASGAAAALLVDLWCPVGHPFHVFWGHIIPMLLLGIIGALVGITVLRLRAARP